MVDYTFLVLVTSRSPDYLGVAAQAVAVPEPTKLAAKDRVDRLCPEPEPNPAHTIDAKHGRPAPQQE